MNRKWLVGCGGLVALGALGVAGAVAAAFVLEDRARSLVQAELDRSLRATVRYDTADVGVFASFPDVGVTITRLTVTGRDAFDGVELANIGELHVAVDAASLWSGGPYEITAVRVRDAKLNVLTDAQGRSNTDIAPPSDPAAPEAPSAPYRVSLASVVVENLDVVWDDRAAGLRAEIRDLDHEASGDVGSDAIDLATRTTIAALTVSDGGVTWLDAAKVDADVDVAVDHATGRVTFGDNRVAINALPLSFSGWIEPQGDDLRMDVRAAAADTTFRTLLSLVPSAYGDGFAGVDASGDLSFAATATGLYKAEGDHLPAFDATLKVSDGRFRYPDLPTAVEAIAVDVAVQHPEGPADLAVIDVRRLAFTAAGSPFEGRARITSPIGDPAVEARLLGKVDLGAVRSALPPDDTKYGGVVDLDLDVAGRMSDFEAQATDRIRATGGFRLAGVTYESPDLPVPMTFESLDVVVSPARAELRDLRLRFADSDLQAKGRLDNLLPYLLADGTLRGELDATSNRLDMTPFEGEDTEADAAAADDEAVIVAVPSDLDLALRANFEQVRANGMDLEDVQGAVIVRDGAVRLDRVRMGMLGGRVTMSGTYLAPTDEAADVDLTVDAAQFDIAKTVATFTTLPALVPIAKQASGRFDTGFTMKTRLKRDGTPDTAIFFSKGKVQGRQLTVAPASFAKVAEQLGQGRFKAVSLDGKALLYELADGKLDLKPFEATVGGVPARFSGGAGVLDRTLDLTCDLRVPATALAGSPLLGGRSDLKEVDVRVRLTGPWDDPKVSVGLQGAVEQGVAEVKEIANAAIDDLVARARAQGDRLVAEAEKVAATLRDEGRKAAAKIRDEADRQAKKLIAEGKGNPVSEAAAKKAADKLRAEADKKADKLEQEADKRAAATVDTAKKQRDELIADAEAKARAQVK